jgi:uncharacterized membrane protein
MVKVGTAKARASRRGWRIAALGVAVAVLATACVMDLTDEVGADAWGYTYSINDDGVMAGSTGQGEPWRFEPGKVRVRLQDPYGLRPYIRGVNNAKEVVGEVWARMPNSARIFPVIWDVWGSIADMRPIIPGGLQPDAAVYPVDLNENGLLVGWVDGADAATPQVFAVDIRNRRSIPIPLDVAGRYGTVSAVNDFGVIVGSHTRWVPSGGSYVAQDLGDFWPTDINNAGDMVGQLGPYGSGVPAYWPAGATGASRLRTTGLPAPGRLNEGMINDNGLIVFTPDSTVSEPTLPARWRSTTSDPELFPADGWSTATLNDLNRHGEAVGYAVRTSDGQRRPVRWDLR